MTGRSDGNGLGCDCPATLGPALRTAHASRLPGVLTVYTHCPHSWTPLLTCRGCQPRRWAGRQPLQDIDKPYPRGELHFKSVKVPAAARPAAVSAFGLAGSFPAAQAPAADAGAAHCGGHERWSRNPNGCDSRGHNPIGIVATSMEGLDPVTGYLLLNSQGTALYTRARGLGADDMLITSAGLWIASDNLQGSQTCNGVQGLAGLCFLPYP